MSITARGLISQACTGWGEISNENDNALQRKIEGKPYRTRARSESHLLTDDCGSLIEPLRNSARSKLWSLRRFRDRVGGGVTFRRPPTPPYVRFRIRRFMKRGERQGDSRNQDD